MAKMEGAEVGEVDCRVRIMRVRSGDQQVICSHLPCSGKHR